MPGTGGVRKVRFAGRSKGKSGGYRVVTYYAALDVPVFLLDCYGKGDEAHLDQGGAERVGEHSGGHRRRVSDQHGT